LRIPRRNTLRTAVALSTACVLSIVGRAAGQIALMGPPPTDGPVPVQVGFNLLDIVEVDDSRKTIEFEAIITLLWQDERLQFDPIEAGTEELVYQGDYQFSEIGTGWWPQLFLRNESGGYERQGVLLRVRPDGQVRYEEEVRAIAEVELKLRRIPFDEQEFTFYFEPLGFDASEVLLEPAPDWTSTRSDNVSVRQWSFGPITSVALEDAVLMQSGRVVVTTVVGFTIPASRRPGFLLRVIVIPLLILVALSWSVFWMASSQLSDRMAISFLGILTVVAFQIVVSEMLPRIPNFTILSSFLLISYLFLVASVIVNLRVGALDQAGRVDAGNRLDRRCRWMFPLAFVIVNLLMAGYYFLRY
jgi:hypothetical protein